jgi:multidrug efflux system membrane fusion protein
MNPPIKGRRPLAVTAISFAVLAALGTATWLGLHSQAVQADAPAAASQAVPVSAALLVQQEVSTWQDFSGRLEAVERVELRSRVAGAIQSVHFREGALEGGRPAGDIDPAPYQAEVDRAAAQVAAAQSQLVFARSEQERANRMLADHAIAQRDADERNNAARAADASLKAAGRLADGTAEPGLHRHPRAGIRPGGQAAGDHRQPGIGRAGFAGAHHPGVGEPGVCQL